MGIIRIGAGTAEIVERKGVLGVDLVLRDGTRIRAERQRNRRIVYDSPERVPRDMKNNIVKQLFKEIDDMKLGTRRSGG